MEKICMLVEENMLERNGLICEKIENTQNILEITVETHNSNLGLEVELLVLDSEFKESNEADKLIDLAKQNGINIEKECSKNMVELITAPGTAKEIIQRISEDYLKLSNLAKTLNLNVLPIDYPLNNEFVPLIREHKKYSVQQEIIGNSFIHAGLVCGTHIHFDIEGTPVDSMKVNILKLIDPIILSVCATTNKKHDGEFIQNWRMYAYRKLTYKNFKYNGGVAPLTNNFTEFMEQMKQLTNTFKNSYKGDENIDECILPYKGVWGSLRIKPEIPTIELRSIGAIPDFKFLELLLKFFERLNYVLATNHQILRIDDLLLRLFQNKDFNVINKMLEDITDLSIKQGLKSESVERYALSFLTFFNDLELEELFMQLMERKNLRNVLISEKTEVSKKYELLCELSEKTAKEVYMEKTICTTISL